jgi:ribosome biogenesis protein BRX1
MDELRLTGNCLKGSRPILSFDESFDKSPHLQLLKEMFTHVFGVPKTSRKIKPFIDHVLSFHIADDRIWMRNYQISEKTAESIRETDLSLIEIGPRLVLNPIRIFAGSFAGTTLWDNEHFVTPTEVRSKSEANLL